MPVNIKVLHGTIPDKHICASCDHSQHRTEGGRDVWICGHLGRIRGRVTDCDLFTPKNQAILGQYREQAWLLHMDEEDEPRFVSPYEREMGSNGRRVRLTVRKNPRRNTANSSIN